MMAPRTAFQPVPPPPAPPAFAGDDPFAPLPLLTMEPDDDDGAWSLLHREAPPYSRPLSPGSEQRVTIELPAIALLPAATDPVSIASLLEQALDAMLRKDHHAALRIYLAAQRLAPEDRTVVANIERLQLLLRRARDDARTARS